MEIQTRELTDFIQNLRDTGRDLAEASGMVTDVAKYILEQAQTFMPSISGEFRGNWFVIPATGLKAHINSGATPYANVQEFGGWVKWTSRDGKYKRVPINGNFRMMKANAIRVKTPIGFTGAESYFVYPAARENQAGIEKVVGDDITKLVTVDLNNR